MSSSDCYHVGAPIPKWKTLFAGAVAGLTVDTSLYPIDTIKSRLQSKQGFSKAGGFAHLYRGLPPVLAGSIPNAAIFFITYESTKNALHKYKSFGPRGNAHLLNHMISASLGEVASCIVRVPYEVVKMRSQTSEKKQRNVDIMRNILAREGFVGMYRGFYSTIMRDLPFSAIQYPIWEKLKSNHRRKYGRPATVGESAYYGTMAGGIAAFLTNPLDVAKTRIMLAERNDPSASGKIIQTLKSVREERGVRGLFAGVWPRVIWISIGAAIFLGSYESALKLTTKNT